MIRFLCFATLLLSVRLALVSADGPSRSHHGYSKVLPVLLPRSAKFGVRQPECTSGYSACPDYPTSCVVNGDYCCNANFSCPEKNKCCPNDAGCCGPLEFCCANAMSGCCPNDHPCTPNCA